MDKKRTPPDPVSPVSRNGIRYEAVNSGKGRGLGQNGGYVALVDAATGEERGLIKVYDIAYDDDLEPDKQDRFITSLTISRWRNRLTVEDERGRRYEIDLATHAVKPL
jgi:hypothetical protein